MVQPQFEQTARTWRAEGRISTSQGRHPSNSPSASKRTFSFAVMDKLVRHPLTDLGIERFLKDWGKVRR